MCVILVAGRNGTTLAATQRSASSRNSAMCCSCSFGIVRMTSSPVLARDRSSRWSAPHTRACFVCLDCTIFAKSDGRTPREVVPDAFERRRASRNTHPCHLSRNILSRRDAPRRVSSSSTHHLELDQGDSSWPAPKKKPGFASPGQKAFCMGTIEKLNKKKV